MSMNKGFNQASVKSFTDSTNSEDSNDLVTIKEAPNQLTLNRAVSGKLLVPSFNNSKDNVQIL